MNRIAIVLATLAIAGCGGSAAREVQFAGIVRYVDLEGSFYAIVDDSGAGYDPNNLPAAFQQDGRRVTGLARVRNDMVSVHMWGTIVDVLQIE
jgi:hypothetical protein